VSASEGAVARGMVYALDEVAERAPLPLTYILAVWTVPGGRLATRKAIARLGCEGGAGRWVVGRGDGYLTRGGAKSGVSCPWTVACWMPIYLLAYLRDLDTCSRVSRLRTCGLTDGWPEENCTGTCVVYF
jgi:hypothetical protein